MLFKKAKEIVDSSNVQYKDIAKELGVGYNSIYRTLNGTRKLDYITAVKFAKILGKKPDEVFYKDAIEYIKNNKGDTKDV